MKLTIVTPVFNGMPWLPACVESVAAQRGDADIEHLIFDGGSTDGSREWLREHAPLGYEAILEPDKGQTDALIKGFARAGGEIWAWLNADDMLEPGAVGKAMRAFEAGPDLVLVTGACLALDADDSIIGLFPAPADTSLRGLLRNGEFPPQPSTFFSAKAYRQTGGLDPKWDLAMDLDLWLKLARIGPMLSLRREILSRYRKHPRSKTDSMTTRSIRQALAVRRHHGTPLRSPVAVVLIRKGYVSPITSRVTRPLKAAVRRVVAGPRG